MVLKQNQAITGKVVTGTQRAAFFTQLDWVKEQCRNKLGFEPYPGTLNLKITEDQMSVSECIRQSAGLELVPPDEDNCPALVFPGTIGEVDVAFVIPHKSAQVHKADILEVIAPVHLRKLMSLQDNDSVIINICL